MTDFEIIKDALGRKETEELLTIWTQNRRDEYRDEAFNAIQKILLERGVDVPAQPPCVPHNETFGTRIQSLGFPILLLTSVVILCVLWIAGCIPKEWQHALRLISIILRKHL